MEQGIKDFIAGKAELELPKTEEEKNEKEETSTEKETQEVDLKGSLFNLAGAPSSKMIETWKTEHGTVLVSGFSPREVLVFRPLKREEYRRIKILASKAQDFTTLDYEEAIVETCVLWPSPGTEQFSVLFRKAGTFSTVYEQISQASNFAPPQIAAAFMAEL